MKKSLLLLPLLLIGGCQPNTCNITESTFFLVMTNIQYYPEEYLNKDISLDCFTYNVEAVNGQKYLCGVRKCTAGFGCKCGKDTVIGFILNYDKEIWRVLTEAGMNGLSVQKIARHVFNASNNHPFNPI